MRINRLRMGIEVFNKLNGKEYKVVEVNGATGIAAEMIKDPVTGLNGVSEEEVTITEENSLAFRILSDPEPYPVPEGYSVEDGVLLKDGKPACAQGEFSFIKILAVWNDCMLLAARLKGTEDGEIALVSYQVSRDRFRRLAVVSENIVFLGYAGDGMEKAVFLFSNTAEDEIEENGEKKTVKCFKETALVIIDKGLSCDYENFDLPVTAEDCFIAKIPGSKDGDFELFLASDVEEKDGWLVPRKERAWIRVESRNMACSPMFSCNGSIHAYWSPAYCDFVIRGKNMVRFKDFVAEGPEVAKLDGYDTLIDLTRENYAYKLTFSDEGYKFKTLVSQSTRVRGYIVVGE